MIEFTRNELRDLTIAFIILSIAFAVSNVRLNLHGFVSILPIVMVGVAVGSLFHEIGHKYVATKYGNEAEFKAWPLGLLIALATSLVGIVFALPGSVQIFPEDMDDEISGKIAIAGPMLNMALAIIFIIVAALIYPLSVNSQFFHLMFLISTVGFSVNSFLATFNLLPLYTLDGTKVLKWNSKIWIIIFILAAIMLLLAIDIGAEDMVKLIIGM